MRRKVIQLARNTLVVSLPSKWAKKYAIKKGDEIEVNESSDGLTIKTVGYSRSERVTFDATKLSASAIKRWALSSLHKKGYDEIEILYQGEDSLKSIHEAVKEILMGFVVMEQSKNRCLIKSITQDHNAEFDSTFRRQFIVVKNFGEEILKYKNDKEALKDVINLDKTVNQLTNYCERNLNKIGRGNKTSFYYVLCWNLEKLSDEYTKIAQIFIENTPSKIEIDIFNKINKFYSDYSDLIFKFNNESMIKLDEDYKKLQREIEIIKNKKLYSHYYTIINKISDTSASIIAINQ